MYKCYVGILHILHRGLFNRDYLLDYIVQCMDK